MYYGFGWEDLVAETEEERIAREREERLKEEQEKKVREQEDYKKNLENLVSFTSKNLKKNSDIIPNKAYMKSWELLEEYRLLISSIDDMHRLSVLSHKKISDILSEYLPEVIEKYRLISPERRMEGSEASDYFLKSVDLFARTVKTAYEELKDDTSYNFIASASSIERILESSALPSKEKEK